MTRVTNESQSRVSNLLKTPIDRDPQYYGTDWGTFQISQSFAEIKLQSLMYFHSGSINNRVTKYYANRQPITTLLIFHLGLAVKQNTWH